MKVGHQIISQTLVNEDVPKFKIEAELFYLLFFSFASSSRCSKSFFRWSAKHFSLAVGFGAFVVSFAILEIMSNQS